MSEWVYECMCVEYECLLCLSCSSFHINTIAQTFVCVINES